MNSIPNLGGGGGRTLNLLTYGSAAYVDATNGNNSTAVVGDPYRPFRTAQAAVAAYSPRLIFAPGSYTLSIGAVDLRIQALIPESVYLVVTHNDSGTCVLRDIGNKSISVFLLRDNSAATQNFELHDVFLNGGNLAGANNATVPTTGAAGTAGAAGADDSYGDIGSNGGGGSAGGDGYPGSTVWHFGGDTYPANLGGVLNLSGGDGSNGGDGGVGGVGGNGGNAVNNSTVGGAGGVGGVGGVGGNGGAAGTYIATGMELRTAVTCLPGTCGTSGIGGIGGVGGDGVDGGNGGNGGNGGIAGAGANGGTAGTAGGVGAAQSNHIGGAGGVGGTPAGVAVALPAGVVQLRSCQVDGATVHAGTLESWLCRIVNTTLTLSGAHTQHGTLVDDTFTA